MSEIEKKREELAAAYIDKTPIIYQTRQNAFLSGWDARDALEKSEQCPALKAKYTRALLEIEKLKASLAEQGPQMDRMLSEKSFAVRLAQFLRWQIADQREAFRRIITQADAEIARLTMENHNLRSVPTRYKG